MTELPASWWQNIARMDRTELVDAFAREAELRGEAEAKTRRLNIEVAQERNRPTVLIASDRNNAEIARKRLGKQLREVIIISTSGDASQANKLRGLRLRPQDVLLVPGWSYMSRFQTIMDIRDALAPNNIDLDQLCYAPSPEFDRVESYADQYGRVRERENQRLRRRISELENITDTHENSPSAGGIGRWLDSKD